VPRVTFNGVDVEVEAGSNLIDAAEAAGHEIPHYCYHPGLSVAGNCRMCLVEIKALSEKQDKPLPKLQIACNTVVQDGMIAESNNDRVAEAGRSVLEFLLINHPIDCPICDQAGECKLQEYYMEYGGYESRVDLDEKVLKAKATPIGPDVMLDQERCILCTRCVRFLDEVTGTHELTINERGDHSVLSLTEGAVLDNPYATNVVDICPVGALTSREFRFQSRVWYLSSKDTICPGCATGCSIEVHSRGSEIFRVKPRNNPEVNGYWICDHGRRVPSLLQGGERLSAHLKREQGRFLTRPVRTAVQYAASLLKDAGPVAVIVSPELSQEEAELLKQVAGLLGSEGCLVFRCEKPAFDDDELLISSDRFPNQQGLEVLGMRSADGPPVDCSLAIVAGCDPAGAGPQWADWLEGLDGLLVLDSHKTETAAYADCLLATATHFESGGTFINKDGLRQSFEAAISPPGDAVEGRLVLGWLVEELGSAAGDSAPPTALESQLAGA
jgi:NADH-quinone oxidoreductase subunit G